MAPIAVLVPFAQGGIAMNRRRSTRRSGKTVVLTALMGVVVALGASTPSAWAAPATATPSWAAAPAGTYHYRQVIPAANPAPTGTVVVAAAGSGAQLWTRSLGAKAAVSTSAMSYKSNGIYALAQREQLSGTTVSCSFAAPLPLLPSPPTAGLTFSGHAACTSGATLTVSGEVAGNAILSFNGQSISTVLVGSTSVMSVSVLGITYQVDVTEVDWYLPTLPIPLQTAMHVVIPSQKSTSDSEFVLQSFTQP
jgi:hypothetical protein